MIEVGRELMQRYVAHKDIILLALQQAWWPHVTIAAVQIERAKTFINRLENQGSVHGLYKQYGMIETQTSDKNLKNINIQLPDGILRMKDYIHTQDARTEWLAEKRPRMLELIQQAGGRDKPK